MIKILFVIPNLGTGGAERQLVELIKGLDPVQVTPLVVVDSYVEEGYQSVLEERGVEIICVARKSQYDLSPIFSMAKIIKDEKIDVVHSFLIFSSFMAAFAARISGCPVVCSALRDAKDRSLKDTLLCRVIARVSDVLVSNSQAGFSNRFRRQRKNFKVIYNGMDFNRFFIDADKQQSLRREFKLDSWNNVIGMVATLSSHKDHPSFLSAAQLVLREKPDTVFMIVGSAKDKARSEQLKELSKELGIEKHVIFTGYRSDVEQIMYLLDIVVLLSDSDVHEEGLPNAVIEAMAIGRPVVASRGGGTAEAVVDGITGTLVDSKAPEQAASAISRVLDDEKIVEKFSENSKRIALERYGLERYVKQYSDIYSELIK